LSLVAHPDPVNARLRHSPQGSNHLHTEETTRREHKKKAPSSPAHSGVQLGSPGCNLPNPSTWMSRDRYVHDHRVPSLSIHGLVTWGKRGGTGEVSVCQAWSSFGIDNRIRVIADSPDVPLDQRTRPIMPLEEGAPPPRRHHLLRAIQVLLDESGHLLVVAQDLLD
jgi:hypothetical protein